MTIIVAEAGVLVSRTVVVGCVGFEIGAPVGRGARVNVLMVELAGVEEACVEISDNEVVVKLTRINEVLVDEVRLGVNRVELAKDEDAGAEETLV